MRHFRYDAWCVIEVNGNVRHQCVMSRDDPHFRLRVPTELKTRIEAAAAENNRSMNAEIVARLEASFQGLDGLPPGLTARVKASADTKGRSVQEEIVQALEISFPAPPPFSLDAFSEKWALEMFAAPQGDWPDIIAKANEELRAHTHGTAFAEFGLWQGYRPDGTPALYVGVKPATK